MLGQHIYYLGEIEVDTTQGCIRRDGEEQYLRQKAFQLLLYLLERRQRLVTKDELIDGIWEGAAVTDDGLVQLIGDIRKALGDDPRHPQFIKTVPKVGYRFIGQVEDHLLGEVGTIETREVTSVEVEYEEEGSDLYRFPEAIARTLPAAKLAGWSNRKLVHISTAAAILVAAIALAIYLRPARLLPTEVKLPQVPGKQPLVVMYFENQSASPDLDWLREGLADMLITDLSRSKKLTVLGRQQLQLLLERINHKQGNTIGLDEALNIGRRSQAEAIVMGSFGRLGDKIHIDAKLYDSHRAELLAAERITLDRPEQILTEVGLLSLKLAARLGASPDDQETKLNLADVMTNNLEAFRYYSLAVEKAQANHNSEAIALLEKAIALDPEFAMAYARIGYVYAVTWAFAEKARPYLEKAFKLSARLTEKDRLYITAWYSTANLDYPAAIEAFKQIIAQYPLEVEAYLKLGNALSGEERCEEAVDVLNRGLVIDAEAKDLYNRLGLVYLELGRHDEAIAAHQRYLQLAPNEPNAHDSLGLSFQAFGQYDEAIAEYNRALALNRAFDVAIIHLGNLYFQQGRYREAISQFRRYAQVAPSELEKSRGYGGMSEVYLRSADFGRAEEAANKEMRSEKLHSWQSLVIALQRGEAAKAKKLEEQLFADWPYTNRGARLSHRLKYYYRGYLELKSGRAADAIENFREALKHRPPYWNYDIFEDCLANAYLELGQLDEAIAEYERVLSINPNYPFAHYHLGQAYEQKGDQERARAEYERFLQVWKDADSDIPEVITAKKQLASQS